MLATLLMVSSTTLLSSWGRNPASRNLKILDGVAESMRLPTVAANELGVVGIADNGVELALGEVRLVVDVMSLCSSMGFLFRFRSLFLMVSAF